MACKKVGLDRKSLQNIVDNLSDLSDLDSDEDDDYVESVPINSPNTNLDDESIIERRLNGMFGFADTEGDTIPDFTVEETVNTTTESLLEVLGTDNQNNVMSDVSHQCTSTISVQEDNTNNVCFDEILSDNNFVPMEPMVFDDIEYIDNIIDMEMETSEDNSGTRRITNRASRTRQPREWKIENTIHNIPEFKTPISSRSTYNHKSRPIDIFEKLFPEYLVEIIVEQTNRYAIQKNSKNWTPTSGREIKAYLGILIMMGLNPMPDMELYWSVDPFYNNPEISKVLTLKRFKKITENLHINDNQQEPPRNSQNFDKLYKLRPMIEELNKVYQRETRNSSVQSIDECMVKFKGRSSLKQYMPKKPIKRGFKVWARCDAKTGYLYQFEVYTGKGDSMEEEGLGYNVVSKLSRELPHNTLIAFDNFFTSCNLMEDLFTRKIFAVGTVRTNRKDLPPILQKSQPKNLRLKKHEFTAITAAPITAIKWLDTREVTVLTTAHHPTDTMYVKRTQKNGSRQEVLCPTAIASYTLSMGGVDHFDHFRSSYPINRKCRKFWMRLFFFTLDSSIINSYITYNTVHVVKTHSHRDFRLRLARELIDNFTNKKNRPIVFKNKKGTNGVPDEIRLLNVGVHLPDEGNTYKRCRFCSTKKKEKRTKIICSTCQISLCAKKCFKEFHLAPAQD